MCSKTTCNRNINNKKMMRSASITLFQDTLIKNFHLNHNLISIYLLTFPIPKKKKLCASTSHHSLNHNSEGFKLLSKGRRRERMKPKVFYFDVEGRVSFILLELICNALFPLRFLFS
jgi:hypothetical protein